MLFNSVEYLLFLPTIVGLYWLLKKQWRPVFLLGASYFFYMSWFPPYCLLLAGLTLSNYYLGLAISRLRDEPSKKKLVFLGGLFLNLGCLAFFKYANFLLDLASPLLKQFLPLSSNAAVNLASGGFHLNILLPLAISFFVFEFVHYLGDIYNGNEPIKQPIRFGLFAAFFPSQIAGPIKRYEQFDAQFAVMQPFSSALFQQGLALILQGFFKKVALGDNLVPIVDRGFNSIQYLAPCDAWVAALAFTFQIYYDFSGYTDIGRGSAMLLGIRLPENFRSPYLSTSLVDFWRRWHITLSSWLRDYLYKPLGGSRRGGLLQNRNLLITMLLGGLWHGASWHFVIWGAFHGTGLVINHQWQKLFAAKPAFAAKPPKDAVSIEPSASVPASFGANLISGLCTFVFVLLGWVLFRADTFEAACSMYRHMLMPSASTLASGFLLSALCTSTVPAAFLVYGVLMLIQRFVGSPGSDASDLEHKHVAGTSGASPSRARFLPGTGMKMAGYASFILIILCLASKKAAPFIYFQF